MGNFKHVYDGWPIARKLSIECFCTEGNKISKHKKHYLIVAQRGIADPATEHMLILAC